MAWTDAVPQRVLGLGKFWVPYRQQLCVCAWIVYDIPVPILFHLVELADVPASILLPFLRVQAHALDNIWAFVQEEMSKPHRATRAVDDPDEIRVIVPWPGIPHHLDQEGWWKQEELTFKLPCAKEKDIILGPAKHRSSWRQEQVNIDATALEMKLTSLAKVLFQSLAVADLKCSRALEIEQPGPANFAAKVPSCSQVQGTNSKCVPLQIYSLPPITVGPSALETFDFRPPTPILPFTTPALPAICAAVKSAVSNTSSEVTIGDTISSASSFITDADDSEYLPESESESEPPPGTMVDIRELMDISHVLAGWSSDEEGEISSRPSKRARTRSSSV